MLGCIYMTCHRSNASSIFDPHSSLAPTLNSLTQLQSFLLDKMRMSKLSMATAVTLILMLTAMEVEGIRLDAETREATSKQMVNKSTENVPKDSGDSVGEAKRSIAGNEVRAVAHKLPEFHEDYYGPRDHTPRHH